MALEEPEFMVRQKAMIDELDMYADPETSNTEEPLVKRRRLQEILQADGQSADGETNTEEIAESLVQMGRAV